MIAVALILVIALAVWVGGVLAGSTGTAVFSVFGIDRELSTNTVFGLGVGTGIVIMLCVWLLIAAMRRDRRRRIEHRDLARRRDELEEERVRLDERLGNRPDGEPEAPPSRFDPS